MTLRPARRTYDHHRCESLAIVGALAVLFALIACLVMLAISY